MIMTLRYLNDLEKAPNGHDHRRGRACALPSTWLRFTPDYPFRRPGGLNPRGHLMRPDIHPAYVETQVTCSCGNTFTTHSTASSGSIHAEVCSQCHPFYTGKQKILDV